jgi:hypothetical protein
MMMGYAGGPGPETITRRVLTNRHVIDLLIADRLRHAAAPLATTDRHAVLWTTRSPGSTEDPAVSESTVKFRQMEADDGRANEHRS